MYVDNRKLLRFCNNPIFPENVFKSWYIRIQNKCKTIKPVAVRATDTLLMIESFLTEYLTGPNNF